MVNGEEYFSDSSHRQGFTIIELLVFSAIFSAIIGAFITILIVVTTVQTRQAAVSEAGQQGQFLSQEIQYYIESARLVDMTQDVATTTLQLRESVASSSFDPTDITLSSGTAYLQQGLTGTLQPLTSKKVTISNLSFTRHFNLNSTSSAFGEDSVSYSFMISAANTNGAQYTETFQSSASVLAPVGKIGLIQQAKGESNNATVSSIATAYGSNNETGDLLIAVIANKGIVTSTVADTEGNTWKQVASTSYSAYSEEMSIYYALNAKNGSNTVTVSFASGASYASMFLYEYRGASTSSSADVHAGQIQANTSTPSSGYVTPTSSAELLLGADYNANTTAVPAAGTGYTLETSSTALNTTQVFVEDQNQFITGTVAANWSYSGTPSSTAMIVTFK